MARIVLAQTSFAAGELSPRVMGRTDMDRYAYGLKRCRNALPVLHGGVKRRPGSMWVADALSDTAGASVLIGFVQGRTAAWVCEFGNGTVRIRDTEGAIVATLPTPYTSAQLVELDWVQSDSSLWLFHPQVPIYRIERLPDGVWAIGAAAFTTEPFAEIGIRPAAGGSISNWLTVGATGTALLGLGSPPFLPSDVGRAIVQGPGIAVITTYTSTTIVDYVLQRPFLSGVITSGEWLLEGSPHTTCTPSAVGPVGAIITLTLTAAGWRAGDVGSMVRINGGLCVITSYTSTTVVNARVLRELTATVGAPSLSWTLEQKAWSAANGYPRTGTIYQQRLIAAGTAKYPRTVWGSRSGELLDFERWTNDSDSFAFTIDSDDATAITYITAAQQLAVLTESGEYSMRGGVEKPITPTNVQVKLESTHGCAQVRPVQINRETLFVQRAGRKVRAFGYRYDFDGFSAPDVTALAEHITYSGITQMTWGQEPEQVLWAVRADGKLASCTVDRDQQPSVLAWALHETDGVVEAITSVPRNDEDSIWLIVRRTVGGVQQRFIERLESALEAMHPNDPDPDDGSPRPVYGATVDCALLFDNPAGATSFSVPHLIGKTVHIVADGSVMPSQPVSPAGMVTIERPGRRVLIGLPFETRITLLTPEVQGAMGSAQGQAARTGEMFVRVLDTIGAEVQNNQGNREPVPFRRFGPAVLDQPPKPYTGGVRVNLLGWERGESEVSVYQPQPLPLFVLSVVRTHQSAS